MPFAEAIAGLIDQHRARLEAVTAGLDDARATRQPAPGEWSVNETLLHLIGDTASFPREIRSALTGTNPPQRLDQAGGAYTSVGAEDRSVAALRARLFANLDATKAAIAGLPDEALGNTQQIEGSEMWQSDGGCGSRCRATSMSTSSRSRRRRARRRAP